MKRYILAAAAAAALTAWTLPARAHDDDKAGPHHGEEMDGPEHHDPAKMMEKMKDKLGLSDDQAAKLKDAMKAHGDAMKPLHDAMHDGMKKLGEQLKSTADDKDISASLDALKAARASVQAEQDKLDATLKAFLTPTQRAKLLMGMMMHMRHEGGPWGGRRMGRGRGPGMRGGDEHGPHRGEGDGPKDKDDDGDDD